MKKKVLFYILGVIVVFAVFGLIANGAGLFKGFALVRPKVALKVGDIVGLKIKSTGKYCYAKDSSVDMLCNNNELSHLGNIKIAKFSGSKSDNNNINVGDEIYLISQASNIYCGLHNGTIKCDKKEGPDFNKGYYAYIYQVGKTSNSTSQIYLNDEITLFNKSLKKYCYYNGTKMTCGDTALDNNAKYQFVSMRDTPKATTSSNSTSSNSSSGSGASNNSSSNSVASTSSNSTSSGSSNTVAPSSVTPSSVAPSSSNPPSTTNSNKVKFDDVVRDGDYVAIRSSWNMYCSPSNSDSTHEITCSDKQIGDEEQFIIERRKGSGNLMGGQDYFAIKSKKYGKYCQPAASGLNSKNNVTCDQTYPWDKWIFTKTNPNSSPIKNTSNVYIIPENTYKCYIKKDSDATFQCDNSDPFLRAQFTVVKTFDKHANQKTDYASKQPAIIGSVFQNANYEGWEYALTQDGKIDFEILDSVSSMRLAKKYQARIYSITDPKVGVTKPSMTVLSDVPRFNFGDTMSSINIVKDSVKANNCTVVLYRDTKYNKNPIILGKNAHPEKTYKYLSDIDWNDSASSMLISGGGDCYAEAWSDASLMGDKIIFSGNNYDLHMNDDVKYIKFDKSNFGQGSL